MKEIKLHLKDPTLDEQAALLNCMENHEAMERLRREAYEIRAYADGLTGCSVGEYANMFYTILGKIDEM
jgi:hypothetical protein